MSTSHRPVFSRRIVSLVCGLLGLWLLADAIGIHIDGLRTRHIEYTQNVTLFVVMSVVFVLAGGALQVAAWRLWRLPDLMLRTPPNTYQARGVK